ncbi:hypothetical protein F2Q68_00009664 [Brassica cretica]|uniref:Uncharacterized protein n=1 Tax=Brassica cretica TaxID=69181 RepID=A0A8S9L6R4_BRACR|nr:hypothetical protein F2Q68_00009664 [Brassica cretica]
MGPRRSCFLKSSTSSIKARIFMAARELLVDSSDKVCLSVSSSVWRVSRRLAFLILGVSDLEEFSAARVAHCFIPAHGDVWCSGAGEPVLLPLSLFVSACGFGVVILSPELRSRGGPQASTTNLLPFHPDFLAGSGFGRRNEALLLIWTNKVKREYEVWSEIV